MRCRRSTQEHVARKVIPEVHLHIVLECLNFHDLNVARDGVESLHRNCLEACCLCICDGESLDLLCLKLGSSKRALVVRLLNECLLLLLDGDALAALLNQKLVGLLRRELKTLLLDLGRDDDVGDAHPVNRDARVHRVHLLLDLLLQAIVECVEVSDLDLVDCALGTQLAHALAEWVEHEHRVVVEAELGDHRDDGLRLDAVGDLDARDLDVDTLLRDAPQVLEKIGILDVLDMADVRRERVVEVDARLKVGLDLAHPAVDADVSARDGSVEGLGQRAQGEEKHHRAHFERRR